MIFQDMTKLNNILLLFPFHCYFIAKCKYSLKFMAKQNGHIFFRETSTTLRTGFVVLLAVTSYTLETCITRTTAWISIGYAYLYGDTRLLARARV